MRINSEKSTNLKALKLEALFNYKKIELKTLTTRF